jgi:predicted nucleotide-binding protein
MAKKKNPTASASSKQLRSKTIVFISHSSRDRWITRKMAEDIRAVGAEVWVDEKDLEGGDVIVEKILQGVDACTEAIILLSPDSVNSQWVVFEIGALRMKHRRITPVLHRVRAGTIAPLKDVKAIELNQFADFLEQLKERISDS